MLILIRISVSRVFEPRRLPCPQVMLRTKNPILDKRHTQLCSCSMWFLFVVCSQSAKFELLHTSSTTIVIPVCGCKPGVLWLLEAMESEVALNLPMELWLYSQLAQSQSVAEEPVRVSKQDTDSSGLTDSEWDKLYGCDGCCFGWTA